MIKIAIFNQKGGVGKSSATVNIAGCLDREFEKRVLVMDCDAQQNSSMQLLNRTAENTIRKILTGEADLNDSIYSVSIVSGNKTYETNIDVLASGKDIDILGPTDPQAYKNITNKLEDLYDYCLIDCPPQKMATAITSLCACDYVLVPIFTETDESFQGLDMVIDLVNDLKNTRMNETVDVLGLFITKLKKNRKLDSQMYEYCRSMYGDFLFESTIREAQDICESYMLRKPVIYYKRTCNAAKDYKTATEELMKRIEEKSRKAGI